MFVIAEKGIVTPPLGNGSGGFICFVYSQVTIPCILTYLNLLNFSLYFPTTLKYVGEELGLLPLPRSRYGRGPQI